MDRTEQCTRRELRYLHSMKSLPSTFPAFKEHTLYWGTRLRNKQWQQSNSATVWMVILTSRILLAGKWSPYLTKFTQRVCVRRRPKNPACYFPSQCLIYYLPPKGMKVQSRLCSETRGDITAPAALAPGGAALLGSVHTRLLIRTRYRGWVTGGGGEAREYQGTLCEGNLFAKRSQEGSV